MSGTHQCHAIGCTASVPPKMQMCRRHWAMVPKFRQRALWNAYDEGQEDRKDPSPAYLYAAAATIKAAAEAEGIDPAVIAAEVADYHRIAETIRARRAR